MKRNKLGSLLIKVYAPIRYVTSGVLNACYSLKFRKAPKICFEEFSSLSEQNFRNKIMSFPYKADPLKGLIDFTFKDARFFFWRDLPLGRDCDDFASMWNLYHKANGRKSSIYIVFPDLKVQQSHAVCIVEGDEEYTMYDYRNKYSDKNLDQLMFSYYDSKTISWGKI